MYGTEVRHWRNQIAFKAPLCVERLCKTDCRDVLFYFDVVLCLRDKEAGIPESPVAMATFRSKRNRMR